MVHAYIEGVVTARTFESRELVFDVVLFNGGDSPVYVRAIRLLRDEEDEAAVVVHPSVDAVMDAAGLGIFGPTPESLMAFIAAANVGREIVHKSTRRRLTLPLLLEASESARAHCGAYVSRPDENNDWTLRAEWEDPQKQESKDTEGALAEGRSSESNAGK